MASEIQYDLSLLVYTPVLANDMSVSCSMDGNIVLTGLNNIVVNDVASASSIDNVAVTQSNLIARPEIQYDLSLLVSATSSVVANDMRSLSSSDDVALTQWEVLEAATSETTYSDTDVAYGNTYIYRVTDSDSVVLYSDEVEYNWLIANDATSSTSMDNVTLIRNGLLVNDIGCLATVDNVVITQLHTLAANDIAVAASIDNVVIDTSVPDLVIADILCGTAIDAVVITQAHTVAASDMACGTMVDNVVIVYDGSAHLLASDISVATTMDSVGLWYPDIYVATTMDNVSITTVSIDWLEVDDIYVGQWQEEDSVAGSWTTV